MYTQTEAPESSAKKSARRASVSEGVYHKYALASDQQRPASFTGSKAPYTDSDNALTKASITAAGNSTVTSPDSTTGSVVSNNQGATVTGRSEEEVLETLKRTASGQSDAPSEQPSNMDVQVSVFMLLGID